VEPVPLAFEFSILASRLAQAKAERIIIEELRRRGRQEPDLARRRKRDPGKLQIALRVRQETTLSVKEIAARRHPGIPASASLCLLALNNNSSPNLTQGRFEI
jgi:hypothetical protein